MKFIWKATGILLLVGIISSVIFAAAAISEAPQLNENSTTPDGYLTTVLNDDEEVILTLAGAEANRIYAGLDLIPMDLQHAFIAIEDSRFYEHHGIDPIGIARAFVKGVTSLRFSQGASTITQQLLKNNAFANWTDEDAMDKVVRKVQELYLALRLETIKDKDWILENYLNTINLGGGSWGVEAASRRYFNKDVSELTLSECALLAGITKNPEGYNPLKNPERCRERQLLVLKAMLEQEYIDSEQYEEALADDVLTRVEENHTDRTPKVFSYFEDALANAVVSDLMERFGLEQEDAWDKLYRGGLTIYSTVDSEIQAACEQVAGGDYFADEKVQTSIVVLSAFNGSVKGIVGGRGEKEASLTYNRALESIRQPGSTIKVIGQYAEAIDSGAAALGTVYDDCPTAYFDGTPISNAYSAFRGRTTLHNAIVSSCNTIAYQVFEQVGMERTLSRLQQFGISTLTEADQVEALSLGGTYGGVTNLELSAAYNALAANGSYTKPYFYSKVVDHNGDVILEHHEASRQVVSRETASLLTCAMQDVIRRGTATAAAFPDYPQAGKTGTTNDGRDLWMVGYSPYFTCGIWGGYDDNSPQESSRYVKIMWSDLMTLIHDNYKYREFSDEELTEALICSKCGKLAVEGLCDVSDAGDMTCTEYYAYHQLPQENCSCHVKVTICQDSGKIAGRYCPASSQQEKILLNAGSEGTIDYDYINTYDQNETCDRHTAFWDSWFDRPQHEEGGHGGLFDHWGWFGL